MLSAQKSITQHPREMKVEMVLTWFQTVHFDLRHIHVRLNVDHNGTLGYLETAVVEIHRVVTRLGRHVIHGVRAVLVVGQRNREFAAVGAQHLNVQITGSSHATVNVEMRRGVRLHIFPETGTERGDHRRVQGRGYLDPVWRVFRGQAAVIHLKKDTCVRGVESARHFNSANSWTFLLRDTFNFMNTQTTLKFEFIAPEALEI